VELSELLPAQFKTIIMDYLSKESIPADPLQIKVKFQGEKEFDVQVFGLSNLIAFCVISKTKKKRKARSKKNINTDQPNQKPQINFSKKSLETIKENTLELLTSNNSS
jgi:hypothetical protein